MSEPAEYMGRKHAFDTKPEIIECFLKGIEKGMPECTACDLSGISVITIQFWKRTARKALKKIEKKGYKPTVHEEKCIKFLSQHKKAHGKFVEKNLQRIENAADEEKHWHAAAWLLERRDRKNFGRDTIPESEAKTKKKVVKLPISILNLGK